MYRNFYQLHTGAMIFNGDQLWTESDGWSEQPQMVGAVVKADQRWRRRMDAESGMEARPPMVRSETT